MKQLFSRHPATQRTTQRSVLLVLGLLILLPALLFSAYQLANLNAAEEILASTYARQLDGVLSSVNQFAWDVVSGWATSLSAGLAGNDPPDTVLRTALERHAAVDAVFLADTTGGVQALAAARPDPRLGGKLDRVASRAAAGFERLLRLRQTGYVRLEPFVLDSTAGDMRVALLFVAGGNVARLGGFVVDPEKFVTEILGPRLLETAGTEFIVAVFRTGSAATVFATDSVAPGAIHQRRSLWVFPFFEAGIRFRGRSVEELASARSRTTLAQIVLLNLLLVIGVWLTYRNLRREMAFARLKSDFVSNVSHELRTPLALIRMYAETLEMGRVKDDAKRQEYYTTIVAESARLTRLVNNILNFSRMEAGRMPYRFEPFNLNDLVAEVVAVWESHLRNEGICLELACASDLPPLRGDREAVTEALVNLVDNAVKYGGRGKFLRLTTASDGARIVLGVEDHGIGIAPEHLPKIFDMFYRVSGGLVQTSRGSGVGLAIVRHIMNAHQGEATVTSTPGKGSTFSLVFPVYRDI
ncbi:MAG TPA: ATP-binding protein [Bacteroidota bacterium]